MVRSHRDRATELDPRSVEVRFSTKVLDALGDLAAALHFSEHISPETLTTVQDWAAGKTQSVEDILVGLPSIATEIFKHIHATGDKRAEKAWNDMGSDMLEQGFTLIKPRGTEKAKG